MTVQELFNANFLSADLKTRFESVHKKEMEEVLDNLGYIKLNRNGDAFATDEEIKNGIVQFRAEYLAFREAFIDCINLPENETSLLTEEELDFLHKISSLEGEFNLHQYSMEEIENNPIFSRILNWRLCILSIFNETIEPRLTVNSRKDLEKLRTWCGLDSIEEVIDYIGDIDKLSHKLVEQDTYIDSDYRHIVYFKSSIHRFSDLNFILENDKQWFESRFAFIPRESIECYNRSKKDKSLIEKMINDDLNKLMTRLVQVKLWMFGTYNGSLDNDLGPLTLSGLNSMVTYINENYRNPEGFGIKNLLLHLKEDYWALNVTYLIKAFLPVLEKMKESANCDKEKIETISEEMGKLIAQFPKEKDKSEILRVIEDEIGKDLKSTKFRKSKCRSSKGFLRSLGEFFRRLGEMVVKGVNGVIASLKNLFKWFTNCAKILLRELKKIFEMVDKAFAFFFSKREISTSNIETSIFTDYDFNFDGITYISGIGEDVINEHIRKNLQISVAMNEVSEFLGTVVSFAIKIMIGPYGWIQLGIQVIRYLAQNKFSYNRLSFNFN